jgi:metallo-beta-lactamase family protein
MATGGRVLNHLRPRCPIRATPCCSSASRPRGTRGRRLINGESEVKIHGRMIPVHATVDVINSMSAHADSQEILRWLRGFSAPPKRTFLVHGEPTGWTASPR